MYKTMFGHKRVVHVRASRALFTHAVCMVSPVAKGVHTLSGAGDKSKSHYTQTSCQQILPDWKAMLLQGFSTNQHSRQEH